MFICLLDDTIGKHGSWPGAPFQSGWYRFPRVTCSFSFPLAVLNKWWVLDLSKSKSVEKNQRSNQRDNVIDKFSNQIRRNNIIFPTCADTIPQLTTFRANPPTTGHLPNILFGVVRFRERSNYGLSADQSKHVRGDRRQFFCPRNNSSLCTFPSAAFVPRSATLRWLKWKYPLERADTLESDIPSGGNGHHLIYPWPN